MLDFCPQLSNDSLFANSSINVTACGMGEGVSDYNVQLSNPDESYINYTSIVFCNSTFSPMGLFFSVTWLLTLFLTLATTADEFFCPSLEVIAKSLRFSQNVAGVTLLAFGNGAPEIFASLAGATKQRSELVISYLLGSGVFLTCIVAGAIMMVKPFEMVELPFLRDIIFYLVATLWVFWVLWKKVVTLYYALGFIVLYTVYLTIVLVAHHFHRKYLKKHPEFRITRSASLSADTSSSMVKSTIVLNGDEIAPWGVPPFIRSSWSSGDFEQRQSGEFQPTVITEGSFERTSVSIPEVVHCENCFDKASFPVQRRSSYYNFCCYAWESLLKELSPINLNTWDDKWKCGKCFQIMKIPINIVLKLTIPVVSRWCQALNALHCITSPLFFVFAIRRGRFMIHNVVPLWAIILGIGIIVMIIVLATSSPLRPPKYRMIFAVMGFVCSITWVYIIANEIVGLLITLGSIFKISDATLGLTILVWGNSINDVIADLTLAREGYPQMGLSVCFGGPMFNLLIGLGISFTIATLQTPNYLIKITFQQTTKFLIGFLFASLVSSLVIVPCVKFQLKRWYGVYLYVLYATFIVVIILNECGVIPLYEA